MRLLIFSSVISMFFFSCNKDKSEEVPASYIYYEIDGEPTSITSKTDLSFYFGGAIQVVGEENPSTNLYIKAPKLNIIVRDHEAVIQPGVYSGKTYYQSGFTKEAIFQYTHTDNYSYQSDYINPITWVSISSISRDGVKGTFNGYVFNEGTMDTLHITNGDFSIYNYKN